jgi:hypothetical protein
MGRAAEKSNGAPASRRPYRPEPSVQRSGCGLLRVDCLLVALARDRASARSSRVPASSASSTIPSWMLPLDPRRRSRSSLGASGGGWVPGRDVVGPHCRTHSVISPMLARAAGTDGFRASSTRAVTSLEARSRFTRPPGQLLRDLEDGSHGGATVQVSDESSRRYHFAEKQH